VTVLSLPELGELIDEQHTFDLLRVQTLDRYDVASDGDDFRRYLAGEAEPTASRKQPWLDHLRAIVGSGRAWRNVHVLPTPLSDYLRYACEWGYAYNVQAGQDVRIVEPAAADLMHELVAVGDFWVIDQKMVVRMRYNAGGRFVGADPVSDEDHGASFRAVAGLLWRQAEPFTSWWAEHPQYHRSSGAA
jgi:hypothetical protein